MKELLLLLALVPFALLVVLDQRLSTFEVAPVSAPTQSAISVVVPTPAPFIGPPSNVVEAAMQWLGTPYLWGGCTRRGVDCSCFVRNVLLTFGVNAPRTTVEQIRWATPVSRDRLAIGDLVFFDNTCTNCGANPTHVGMYVGGGMMINAGDPVQFAPVFSGFYGARYAGAGRPRWPS